LIRYNVPFIDGQLLPRTTIDIRNKNIRNVTRSKRRTEYVLLSRLRHSVLEKSTKVVHIFAVRCSTCKNVRKNHTRPGGCNNTCAHPPPSAFFSRRGTILFRSRTKIEIAYSTVNGTVVFFSIEILIFYERYLIYEEPAAHLLRLSHSKVILHRAVVHAKHRIFIIKRARMSTGA